MRKNKNSKTGKFYLIMDNNKNQITSLEPVKYTTDGILLKPQFGFEVKNDADKPYLDNKSNNEEELMFDSSDLSIEESYQEILKELSLHK